MTASTRSLAALVMLAAVASGAASAKPRHTTFAEAVKGSPTIVVAKLAEKQPPARDKRVALEVHRTIRGDVKPGLLTIGYADQPGIDRAGVEFIAFLDAEQKWRFVATPIGGNAVDSAVLKLSGFNDWNAHIITPSLVTEEMLKTYLKDGSLTYRFRGSVYFPQPGKAEWKASALNVAGSYDAVKDKAEVSRFPKQEGFEGPPAVHVGMWTDTTLDLVYERDLRRPLTLRGVVEGFDKKTGELLLQFAVTAPEVLTEKAFNDYLADPERGGPFSTFKLTCTPKGGEKVPKTLSLVIGRATEDYYHSLQIDGWQKEPLIVSAQGYHTQSLSYGASGGKAVPKAVTEELARKDGIFRLAAKTDAGDTLVLAFELDDLRQEGPFTWTFRTDLQYALYSGEFKGTVSVCDRETVKPVATFTTKYDGTAFNIRKK